VVLTQTPSLAENGRQCVYYRGMTHVAISPTLAVFMFASLVLAITPGPAVIYLVTRTLSQGRAAGLASIGGVALGNLGNAAVASLGLAVVFAVSARAFTVVKLAGAAYLLFLGIRELRRASVPRDTRAAAPMPRRRAFRDGFLVALLNPKTALFFAAFLPQFIDPAGSALAQSLRLGAAFVSIAACTDTLYVLAAHTLASRIAGLGGALGRYVTGFSFIALGIFVACSGSRTAK
jgi:threonine/homoserine/homoserine lactone efflux protein